MELVGKGLVTTASPCIVPISVCSSSVTARYRVSVPKLTANFPTSGLAARTTIFRPALQNQTQAITSTCWHTSTARQNTLRSSPSVREFGGQRPKMGALCSRLFASKSLEIIVNPESVNKEFLSEIDTLKEAYKRPFYLSNRHVETIFASRYRTLPEVAYEREYLTMSDGGTVTLDWPVGGEDEFQKGQSDTHAPLLVLLPGLTGGSGDTYVRHMLNRARKAGWKVVVFNSRGCAKSPVTSAQFYSASFTGDLSQVVRHVMTLHQNARVYAAGWSLGANILVRYIGQEGERCPLSGAVSLCNPFDLVFADEYFHKGFNNVYDRSLARGLRRIFSEHAPLFEAAGGKFNVPLATNAKTVRDFDDAITRVSFGFDTVDDYYFGSSSSHKIMDVRIPLLCIQAEDDPIAPADGIPRVDIEANSNCALVVTPYGGHLGWVAGREAPFGAPWTDPVVIDYLRLLDTHLQNEEPWAASRWKTAVGVKTAEASADETSPVHSIP